MAASKGMSGPALIKHWILLALPSAARTSLQIAPHTITLAFVGRISTRALAAMSLADTWMYSLMEILWMGVGGSIHVFVSQSHGARSRDAIIGWSIVGGSCTLALGVVIAILWLFGASILGAFGLDTYDGMMQTYMRTAVAVPIVCAVSTIFAEYLVGTQQMSAPAIAEAVATAIEIAVSYTLVFGANGKVASLGIQGAAVATVVSVTVALAGYVLATAIGKPSHADEDAHSVDKAVEAEGSSGTQALLHDEATAQSPEVDEVAPPVNWRRVRRFVFTWKKWMQFLEQAGPNAVTCVVEQGQFVIISFLAAQLGDVDIATHNSLLLLFELISTLTYGMGEATTIAVGYHLGRGDAASARFIAWASTAIATTVSLAIGAGLVLARDVVGRIFSDDPAVISMCHDVVQVLGPAYVLLTLCIMFLCVLDGQARAGIIAAMFVFGCWCIAVPLAFVSVHKTSYGLVGLWMSLLIGYAVTTVLAAAAWWYSDWDALVLDAAARAEVDEAEEEDSDSTSDSAEDAEAPLVERTDAAVVEDGRVN